MTQLFHQRPVRQHRGPVDRVSPMSQFCQVFQVFQVCRVCRACRILALAGVAVVCLACMPASAQVLRDPTLPPPMQGAAAGANAAVQSAADVQPGAVAVIVRQGVPHLMVGMRLYAKGQKVGQARIERITETEVWLREDGALRKIPVFAGIQRTPSTGENAVLSTGKAAPERALPKQ